MGHNNSIYDIGVLLTVRGRILREGLTKPRDVNCGPSAFRSRGRSFYSFTKFLLKNLIELQLDAMNLIKDV